MADLFELMDVSTANVIGHVPTEIEALAIVRDVVAEGGAAAIEELALSHKPIGSQPKLIATGEALADLAFAQTITGA